MAVGAFPDGSSPFGLYDMAGNVWEWCSGLSPGQVKYPFTQKSYEEDLQSEGYRSSCGGAFGHHHWYTRAAYRNNNGLRSWDYNLGFRVVEHLFDPASYILIFPFAGWQPDHRVGAGQRGAALNSRNQFFSALFRPLLNPPNTFFPQNLISINLIW